MMKKKLILSFFFVALGFGVVKAQDLPDKKETLKTVTKVNDYFMKKYADYRTPSFVKNVTRPSNIWTRGVYYEGLMALYSVYPRDDYYKYAVDWSNYHEWGFRNGTTTRNADDYCASQTYIDLYNICPDPERIRKVKANIDMLVNTPQVNDWWWIDAIQMGMPVFAKLGKLTGEQKYFDKMWDMYEYARQVSGYAPSRKIGAIGWADMKVTLRKSGFDCTLNTKPESYEQFQQEITASQMAVVLVSSRDDDTYWKKTGGHYVSISLYDASSDQVFLGDPADPDGNRSWIPLRYVYDALKTVSQYQYLLVQDYAEEQNQWMHDGITDARGGM